MRLALALGQPSVTKMLKSISFKELMQWRAYDKIEPIGQKRGDFQAASICAATMNAVLLSKGIRSKFRVSDFMLEFKEEETKVETTPSGSPPADWQRLKMLARMHYAVSKAEQAPKTSKAQTPRQPRITRPSRTRR
jgi:hypothetical protein